MATSTLIGRGVRVEMGLAEGAAKVISAISLASPAVATSAAHGLASKSLGYLTGMGGMVQLEGQAVRLNPSTAGDFTLEDIDTTSYPAFTAGSIVPITTWATLGRITGYDSGGGAGDKLDDTVLLDDIKKEIQGQLGAQTVTMNLNSQTLSDAGMKELRKVARAAGYAVFRITLKDGNVRFFRGQPSLPGESVQKGAIGTGNFSITIVGFICEGAA